MDCLNVWKLGAAICLIASPTFAEDQFSCSGVNPSWTLEMTDSEATFSYVTAKDLDIPQKTRAKGLNFPLALTLIGGRDTAIVVINERLCSNSEITDYPLSVDILTQKAETPVILTGCCTLP